LPSLVCIKFDKTKQRKREKKRGDGAGVQQQKQKGGGAPFIREVNKFFFLIKKILLSHTVAIAGGVRFPTVAGAPASTTALPFLSFFLPCFRVSSRGQGAVAPTFPPQRGSFAAGAATLLAARPPFELLTSTLFFTFLSPTLTISFL